MPTPKQRALLKFLHDTGGPCPCVFVASHFYRDHRPIARQSAASALAALWRKGWTRKSYDRYSLLSHEITPLGIDALLSAPNEKGIVNPAGDAPLSGHLDEAELANIALVERNGCREDKDYDNN